MSQFFAGVFALIAIVLALTVANMRGEVDMVRLRAAQDAADATLARQLYTRCDASLRARR